MANPLIESLKRKPEDVVSQNEIFVQETVEFLASPEGGEWIGHVLENHNFGEGWSVKDLEWNKIHCLPIDLGELMGLLGENWVTAGITAVLTKTSYGKLKMRIGDGHYFKLPGYSGEDTFEYKGQAKERVKRKINEKLTALSDHELIVAWLSAKECRVIAFKAFTSRELLERLWRNGNIGKDLFDAFGRAIERHKRPQSN